MTHIDYYACNDCGKELPHDPPFTIERPGHVPTLSDAGDALHACSTSCLLRLANEIHRRNDL